jgi:hypothetical protein
VLLFGGVLLAVATFGRMMRQGAPKTELGPIDRFGGAVLGFGEGAIAASLLLFVMDHMLGRDHGLLARSGLGAGGFLVVVLILSGLGRWIWKLWTSEVVVQSPAELPKGVRPSYVHWIPATDPGDRVRVGPLRRQEWHLVDPATATHLVLAWKVLS